MAIDLYILIFTPIFTMLGFVSRVIWERHTKTQQAVKDNKLNSLSFKLNEFYFPIYMKLLKIDKIMTLLAETSSCPLLPVDHSTGKRPLPDTDCIQNIPYEFLWAHYLEIQTIIEEKRSKANPGEEMDSIIEQFNEIINYYQIWKVMNPEYYKKILSEGELMSKITISYHGSPTNGLGTHELIIKFIHELDKRMIGLKNEHKKEMKPKSLYEELRDFTCGWWVEKWKKIRNNNNNDALYRSAQAIL